MKLRLRSLDAKETQKIEVPDSCNLQQLKQIVTLRLFPSSSSSSAVHHSNLILSLNRKDELFGSTSEESIQSLGVTSGDLVYYTTNIYAFSSPNPNLLRTQKDDCSEISPKVEKDVNLMSTQILDCGKVGEFDVDNDEFRGLGDAQVDEVEKSGKIGDNDCGSMNAGISDESVCASDKNPVLVDAQMETMSKLSDSIDHSGDLVHAQIMELVKSDERGESNGRARELMNDNINPNDEMEVDDQTTNDVNTRLSVPGFLRNVYVKEVGVDAAVNGGNHRLLIIAVHAVLLESGFVGYNPVSGLKVNGFHLPDEWPSSAFSLSLHYTLPEISSSEVVKTVVLKFQTLGKFVNVYGSLSRKGNGIHRVCLDEPRFIPALSYVWKKSDCPASEKDIDSSMKLYPNQEIFDFWKIVKDGISYPLLIELCEEVGLVPPPCFMLLPTDLKLKILETLPATNIAKVACVSSELNFVASNNDLWKKKYAEEFGNAGTSSQTESQWKAKFRSAWDNLKKRRKRVCTLLQWRELPDSRPLFPGRRDPNPLGSRFIIGGEYDRLPVFGIPQPPGRRIFRTNCDLGGFDA